MSLKTVKLFLNISSDTWGHCNC